MFHVKQSYSSKYFYRWVNFWCPYCICALNAYMVGGHACMSYDWVHSKVSTLGISTIEKTLIFRGGLVEKNYTLCLFFSPKVTPFYKFHFSNIHFQNATKFHFWRLCYLIKSGNRRTFKTNTQKMTAVPVPFLRYTLIQGFSLSILGL